MFKPVLAPFGIIWCREKLFGSDVVQMSSKMVIVVWFSPTIYGYCCFYAATSLASENNIYILVSWLVNRCWKGVVFYAQSLLSFQPQIWPWLQSCSVRFTRNKRFFSCKCGCQVGFRFIFYDSWLYSLLCVLDKKHLLHDQIVKSTGRSHKLHRISLASRGQCHSIWLVNFLNVIYDLIIH